MASGISDSTVTGSQGTAGPPAAESTHLTLVYPPELRQTFPLCAADTVLGRDPGPGGLRLLHRTISRSHAVLAWETGRRTHVLRDLGSHNGSHVDGVNAAGSPRPLVNQSLLRMGDVLLVYEVTPATIEDPGDVSQEIIPGQAPSMQALRAAMARAAKDPAPVLILGETGTGKEHIARELHRASGRGGPLLALNCAALSPQLVDSQLFGHTKGAFTGATDAQPGLFRAAQDGTLFLDEIGELPLELQPKLLRVLQEGEALPLGATQPVRVDVRVLAATHRDLARAVQEGRFRQDLYARLALWELRVPALRERRVDVLDWVERLHSAWARARGDAGPLRFDADAAELLLRFAWPLNLRGVERLVHELGSVASTEEVLGAAALPAWLNALGESAAEPQQRPAPATARPPIPTREEFVRAFDELEGNVRALARRFGRDRRQIYRWLETHGLADRGSPTDGHP